MEPYLRFILNTEIIENDAGSFRQWSVDRLDLKTNEFKTIAWFEDHMDAVNFMFSKQDDHDLFISTSNRVLEKHKEVLKRLAEL